MRVLVVLCLAFGFVAAQEDEVVSPGTPDTTLGCIREAIRSAIDDDKKDFRKLLEQISSKEDIDGVVSQIAAEYDNLQQNMDETTQTVLADRETCEKNNQEAVFRTNCDLLARMRFFRKGQENLRNLKSKVIAIIYEARQKFAGDGARRLIWFFQDQGIIKNLKEISNCIGRRN